MKLLGELVLASVDSSKDDEIVWTVEACSARKKNEESI